MQRLTVEHETTYTYARPVPLGEHQTLTDRGIPITGTENFGGPIVTAGGLVFCAGTRDEKIRAFDKDTGKELWSHKLPFGGYAAPASYSVNGRQFIDSGDRRRKTRRPPGRRLDGVCVEAVKNGHPGQRLHEASLG